MAFKLASAFVEIGTRMGGLGAGLSKARSMITRGLGSAVSGVTGMMGRLGAMATGVAGLLGGISFAAAIHAGAAGEEMTSMFETVFAEGSEDAKQFAQTLGKDIGRSVGMLMGQMANFQDLFVPLGFGREEAKELSKQLVKLTQDVGSFKNANPADVSRDFNSALVGNHETVRKYGVIITQARLDQELMTMGIKEGTKAATEQQKVQARLNLIMKGTTDAQGDALKTAGSFTNRLLALKGVIQDTLGTIGSAFLPALGQLTKMATEAVRGLQPRIEALAKSFATWSKVIIANWATAWQFITATIKQLPVLWQWAMGRYVRATYDAVVELLGNITDLMQLAFDQWVKMGKLVWAKIFGTKEEVARLADDLFGEFARKMLEKDKAFKAGLAKKGIFSAMSDDMKSALGELKGKYDEATKDLGKKTQAGVSQGLNDAIDGVKGKSVDIKLTGIFGFAEANKRIQEQFLKAENPQAQLVGIGEAQKSLQGQMLSGINMIAKNTGVATQTVQVAGA